MRLHETTRGYMRLQDATLIRLQEAAWGYRKLPMDTPDCMRVFCVGNHGDCFSSWRCISLRCRGWSQEQLLWGRTGHLVSDWQIEADSNFILQMEKYCFILLKSTCEFIIMYSADTDPSPRSFAFSSHLHTVHILQYFCAYLLKVNLINLCTVATEFSLH